MAQDARIRCVGCQTTNDGRAGRIAWWHRDVLAGVGVCRLCSQRRDAEQLRATAIEEAAKRRAMVSA